MSKDIRMKATRELWIERIRKADELIEKEGITSAEASRRVGGYRSGYSDWRKRLKEEGSDDLKIVSYEHPKATVIKPKPQRRDTTKAATQSLFTADQVAQLLRAML